MTTKQIRKIAVGGLGLSALASANQSIGGTNLIGGLAQGYGSMLPATGSLYGASMVIGAARMLQPRRKKR